MNTLVPPEAMERWKKTLGFDADPKLQMHVNLGLLKSYEHMGVVKVGLSKQRNWGRQARARQVDRGCDGGWAVQRAQAYSK